MDQNLQKNQDLKKSSAPKTESNAVDINRVFQCSPTEVFKAWSTPELIKQWWGPEEFSCPEAKIDFRVGGKYLLAMKNDADGSVTWSAGAYDEIVPNEKIVYSDSFSDEKGNLISPREAGMPFDMPKITRVTIELREGPEDDQCTMHLHHEGIPDEMHDDCVDGWSSSIDKMQRLVERQ